MPGFDPSLGVYNTYGAVAGGDSEARVTLSPDKALQRAGQQSFVNVFSRAWDCLTRSPEEIAANKQIARDFVQTIERTYGKSVANMASRELSAHLSKGRPLTTYRIAQTIGKAQEMSKKIAASNDRLLYRHGGEIMDRALQANLGSREMPNPTLFDRHEMMDVVDRAITSAPLFSKEKFRPDDPRFVDHFSEVAARAIEREMARKLMPNMTAIVAPTSDGVSGAKDEIEQFSERFDLPDGAAPKFLAATQFLTVVSDVVANAGREPLSESSARVCLGYLEKLQNELGSPRDGAAPRLGDLPGPGGDGGLPEDAHAYRQAILADTQSLATNVEGLLGWSTLEPPVQQALKDANNLVGGLRQSIESGNMALVLNAAPEHLERLNALLVTLEAANPGDPGAAALVSALRKDCQAMVTLLTSARAAMAKGFDAGDIQSMHTQGLDIAATAARFTPGEIALAKEAGMSVATMIEYRDRQIPIHPRTIARNYSGDRVEGEPRKLSGGAISSPMLVNYRGLDGELRPMVYKEARIGEGYSGASLSLGIPPDDSRMAVRNIATRAVDELLEFHLVPDTQIGTLGGKPGVVMDFVSGATAQKKVDEDITETDKGRQISGLLADPGAAGFDSREEVLLAFEVSEKNGRIISQKTVAIDLNYDDPGLRRDLVKLQLLDALTAQGDRHAGNYVVQRGDDGSYAGLKAIDNDQAFGPKIKDPNELLKRSPGAMDLVIEGRAYGNSNFNGVVLPEVVDTDMVEAFNRVTPETLRAQLAGLLPEAEIEAAVDRLGVIKAHLESDRCRVIAPDAWGSEGATTGLQNPDTSYIAREVRARGQLPTMTYDEARN